MSSGAQPASCAGRADYFGALPNLAARVSALAAPGQVLVEGSAGFGGPAWAHAECGLVLLPPAGAPGGTHPSRSIELEPLGYYLLKARPSCAQGTAWGSRTPTSVSWLCPYLCPPPGASLPAVSARQHHPAVPGAGQDMQTQAW